jgi:serine/threonine protein phosphatase PrpC
VTWKAIARSAIGTSHQQQQLPCQDYGGVDTVSLQAMNDVIIGVVADGAGSVKYADVGAKLAVKIGLGYLANIEKWLRQRSHSSWPSLVQSPSQAQARKLFTQMGTKVISALQKQAVNSGYLVDDLACTLLAFVATPHWIAAAQIGDGFMVVRSQEEGYQLLFQPDRGEFANQTTFITSTNALEEMQVRVLSGHQTFICAATDALEKIAIRMSDWTPFPPFFKPLEEYLQEITDPEQEDEYLISFLESERLNQRTDDDKTLLLCLYERE